MFSSQSFYLQNIFTAEILSAVSLYTLYMFIYILRYFNEDTV